MKNEFLKAQKNKKLKRKLVIAALILIAVIAAGIYCKNIFFESTNDVKDGKVSIEIRCDELSKHKEALTDKALKSYIPDDGVIVAKTEYKITENKTTVMDILQKSCKENDVQIEEKDGYIRGINYLYEFSAGKKSGWMYTVNGKFPNYGSNEVYLKDGDKIIWLYTIDYDKENSDMQ
ncbi:MAG: DUF4430 domain-containing protein [Eubacterium sp.]|nr:DUF4430 domain-containing protein [Eubacterium sp.]